jgi:hypothetical protein
MQRIVRVSIRVARLLARRSYEGSTRLRNVHSRLLCHVPVVASAKVEVRRAMSRIEKRARAEVGTAKESALEDRYLALGLVAIMLSSVATPSTPLYFSFVPPRQQRLPLASRCLLRHS